MAISNEPQLVLIGRRMAAAIAVLLFCGLFWGMTDAGHSRVRPISSVPVYGKKNKVLVTGHEPEHRRRLATLVDDPPMILHYHNGPIISTRPVVPVYIIWYGNFTKHQMDTIRDFFSCFKKDRRHPGQHPTVKTWWNLTAAYKDNTGSSVAEMFRVENEMFDKKASKGVELTNDDLEAIVLSSLKKFPISPTSLYLLFTAENIFIEDFCMNSCASHFSTLPEDETRGHQLPYLWVGNSAKQCPGLCAWPFAKSEYGPPDAPLIAPNGDVGVDGMIINLGSMLAGSATNPFNSGFYIGDASDPLEAATACTGIYGPGAYPGYTGALMKNKRTGASFNAHGIHHREFLLPALWSPNTLFCTAP